ncbi:MAG: HNH endonuclease signature motif containing protein [Paenibacillus sp.]|nr:HNH endonuclease signature motif containing protein [Paenibacillus sp.]MDU4696757.1 HNH endonuclease signature motif containing protein [Paenibacillus sp.]
MTQQQHPEHVSTSAKAVKICAYCGQSKPLGEFLRRTGKRSGKGSRRGACRSCRALRKAQQAALPLAAAHEPAGAALVAPAAMPAAAAPSGDDRVREAAAGPSAPPGAEAGAAAGTAKAARKRKRKRRSKKAAVQIAAFQDGASAANAAPAGGAAGRPGADAAAPKRRIKRALPAPPPKVEGPDVRTLRPNRNGMIRLRGRTDKGRRWQQEIDYELAVTLVREHMAVVVNPFTIRRLYTNKAFRHYILTRDHYTCFFCGEYGDTIDHLLPKAKGGHTSPVNCVCACNLCNQSKADRWLDDFMQDDAL